MRLEYEVEYSNLQVEAITQDFILLKSINSSVSGSSVYLFNTKENTRLELDYMNQELANICKKKFLIAMNNNLVALSFFYNKKKCELVRRDCSIVKLWS